MTPLRLLSGVCLALCGCDALSGPKQDLSVAQLHAVVDAQRPTLEACYKTALAKNPYRERVELTAVIGIAPSGKVEEVELEGSGLPGMIKCIEESIARWPFPRARDSTHTSLPIVFEPEVVEKPDLEALRQQGRLP